MIPWFFWPFLKVFRSSWILACGHFQKWRKNQGIVLALSPPIVYWCLCTIVNVTYTMYVKLRLFFSLYACKDCSLHWSSVCKHCSYPSLRHWPWSRTCTAQGNGQKWFFFFFFFFFLSFCFWQGAGLDLRRKFSVWL